MAAITSTVDLVKSLMESLDEKKKSMATIESDLKRLELIKAPLEKSIWNIRRRLAVELRKFDPDGFDWVRQAALESSDRETVVKT